MSRLRLILLLLGITAVAVVVWGIGTSGIFREEETAGPSHETAGHAGSISCRCCHERFYELWSSSFHGLAMQPYTYEFAQMTLTPQEETVRIQAAEYLAQIGPGEGWVTEVTWPAETRYPIQHVMGGKNVCYFLTPMEGGRLQVLPVAYDVRKGEWFDTAASAVRHFPGLGESGQLDWRDPLYTFNTSCHSCHVSQLSTNYDPPSDTYHTVWAEPGISCETCHGPGEQHARVCRAAPEGQPPEDLKIIITGEFTAEQTNAMCGSCHAKLATVSASFMPGDRFFDHYDLIGLEDNDFYPDGRDLGENYSYTTWLMSPCVKSGQLDCMHCHTSSGRYRFTEPSEANNACLPCHQERVRNATAHTHHLAGGEGSRCIACHMPMTGFARMRRTDHSMRPPMPACTIAFESPNACTLCHPEEGAAWADEYVRQWHQRDYQAPVVRLGHLVDEARKSDWSHLRDILDYLADGNHDEVFAAGLVRLLNNCRSEDKWPVLDELARSDASPLVRASAAEALDQHFTRDSLEALLGAVTDEYRLVRVRAASSLAGLPAGMLGQAQRGALERATAEFTAAMLARPDDYALHYNLGNFQMKRGQYPLAISAFETSHKLRPDSVLPLNNIAFAYNALGQNEKAEESFRKALALEPDNLAANLNLGMLLAELGRLDEAETAFRAALESDPDCATAAYNLGVLLASSRPEQSILLCRKAYEARPEEGKYGYTYAFYLHQRGDTDKAVEVLADMVDRQVPYADAYTLLGRIHLDRGDREKAAEVFRTALANEALSATERQHFAEMLQLAGEGM